MAVAYRASGALTGALTSADVTPPNPAGHAADDILICITINRITTNTCATPSGWTLLTGPNDDTSWRTYLFWKRATSGAETDPLCDWSGADADKYAQVHSISGAITSGDPFAATAWTNGTANPAVATGVTTTAAAQYVCTIGMGDDNLTTSATVTATDPSSFTNQNFSTTITGADANSHFFDATRATAGATGNISFAFNAASNHWGILIAAILVAGAVDSGAQNSSAIDRMGLNLAY